MQQERYFGGTYDCVFLTSLEISQSTLCGREQSITQHDFNPAGVWTMMTEQHENPEVAL